MIMETDVKPTTEQVGVQATEKAAYVLLEVLVYGTEDKKAEIKKTHFNTFPRLYS